MARLEIISEDPISLAELKGELKKVKKRDEELSFRAGKTEDYLNSFTTLSQAKAKELQESLTKLEIPRLKDLHIVKIVDLVPQSADDVKLVLQGYPITVNNDNCKKIADAVLAVL